MRGKLPETVLKRKKTGFDIPTHDWFRGRFARLADGYADARSDRRRPEFSMRARFRH